MIMFESIKLRASLIQKSLTNQQIRQTTPKELAAALNGGINFFHDCIHKARY